MENPTTKLSYVVLSIVTKLHLFFTVFFRGIEMAEARGIWKRLFDVLFKNKEPDDELPDMWSQFKMDHLHRSEIRTAIESFKELLCEDVRKKFSDMSSEESESEVKDLNSSLSESSLQQFQLLEKLIEKLCDLSIDEKSGEAEILDLMRKCSLLDDDFWRLLFTAIRDSKVAEVSEEQRIPILEGGQTKHMSLTEIGQKFISENPNLLTEQRSVPDQMIHEDLIDAHFSTDHFKESLKRCYESKFSEAKRTLADDNPRLTIKEVEKQAAAQAKQETCESRETQFLKHRVAMKAEYLVQKSILRAMEEFGIPVYVFRGVNTYDDIGKLLHEGLGFKISRLKAFWSGGSKSTLECENDISAMALLPSGPLVSFIQVYKTSI